MESKYHNQYFDRTFRDKYEELLTLYNNLRELERRATGRTTIIVDDAIQRLFNHPYDWTFVCDHHDSIQASKMVVDKIKKRLINEHRLDIEIKSSFENGRNGFLIRLKNYKKPQIDEEFKEKMIERVKELEKELIK